MRTENYHSREKKIKDSTSPSRGFYPMNTRILHFDYGSPSNCHVCIILKKKSCNEINQISKKDNPQN